MERDDLMKLFGLQDKPIAKVRIEQEVPGVVTVDPDLTPSLPVGDTCFYLDQWELAQGTRLATRARDNCLELADFFAAAFRQDPKVEFECADKLLGEFVNSLLESTDFQVLHESTRSNVLASDMAAVQFAAQFHALQREESKVTSSGKTETEREMACLAAVGQAVQQAQSEVDTLEDVVYCMGMGGDGAENKGMDATKIARVFQRVRNNGQLRRICELAGRYRRIAQSKQRQKTVHGYDDMVGVEMAGDVGRLLPLEMAMLADEDFELDAMRRLVEKQSMCRQFRGVENQAKGPIIVCVDESGSMAGEPVANAKAFALAMAWIANHQGRWCGLVSYSGGTEGYILALPPGKWNQEKLTEWLMHFYGGGTDMDVPLKELPTRYWQELGAPKGKTDVILISDAICHVPDWMRDQFNEWKRREKVKCVSMIVGQRSAGGLASVSDEVHLVSTINPEDSSVTSCFSV